MATGAPAGAAVGDIPGSPERWPPATSPSVRPVEGAEALAVDRNLLYAVALFGVLVLAADGISTGSGSTPSCAASSPWLVLAVVGILQFRGFDVSGIFRFPFLSEIAGLAEVQGEAQRRSAATASH